MAPFVGGFITISHLGWRWTEYLVGIMVRSAKYDQVATLLTAISFQGFASFTLNLFFLRETYPPVILIEKADELRRRTKNWGIHAKQEEIEVDLRELVERNFSRPLRMLFTEPIVLLLRYVEAK